MVESSKESVRTIDAYSGHEEGLKIMQKKLYKNTLSSLIFEVSTIICGFILPRLILSSYGSEINGLVTSITQFLQIIAFFELGVGAVVQSTLYKPLAEKDNTKISAIIKSANNFFQKLAIGLLLYVVILCICYPLLVSNESASFITEVFLILAISISFFSQYYFGVVDRLLLTADQRGYVQYNAQTITILLNTFACAILINIGVSIVVVKLVTSLIYLIRPLYLRIYVGKHYNLDRKITYDADPITQKKNGIAQHIASVILNNTDTVVLTLFSTLSNVSIYSIYNMVVFGVKQMFTSATAGIQALLGELWAKQDLVKLEHFFGIAEWLIHTAVVIFFGCTGVLLIPFVSIYTNNIIDANYIQPVFAVLITLAHAGHCLRLPYNILILAGGHYKQTQSNYVVAAFANLIISIVAVKFWGLIGVALGTLVAMLYQTIWMAIYDSKHFLNRSLLIFIKQIIVDICVIIVAILICQSISFEVKNYISWFVTASIVFIIWVLVSCVINIVVYRSKIQFVCKYIQRKIRKLNS